jgi:hypothetical protein
MGARGRTEPVAQPVTTEVLVGLWSALGFEEFLTKAQQVIKTLEWKA